MNDLERAICAAIVNRELESWVWLQCVTCFRQYFSVIGVQDNMGKFRVRDCCGGGMHILGVLAKERGVNEPQTG